MFILSLATLVAALTVIAFGVVLAETTLVYIALVLGGIGAVLLVAEAVRARRYLRTGSVSEAAVSGAGRSGARTDGLGKASVPAQTPGTPTASVAAGESRTTEGARETEGVPAQSAAGAPMQRPAAPHSHPLPGRPDEGAVAPGAYAGASVAHGAPADADLPEEWAARDFDDAAPAPAPAPGGASPAEEAPAAAPEVPAPAEEPVVEPGTGGTAPRPEPDQEPETEPAAEAPSAEPAAVAAPGVPVDESDRDLSFSAFVGGLSRDHDTPERAHPYDEEPGEGGQPESAAAEPGAAEAPPAADADGDPPTEPIDLRSATATEPEGRAAEAAAEKDR